MRITKHFKIEEKHTSHNYALCARLMCNSCIVLEYFALFFENIENQCMDSYTLFLCHKNCVVCQILRFLYFIIACLKKTRGNSLKTKSFNPQSSTENFQPSVFDTQSDVTHFLLQNHKCQTFHLVLSDE